MEVFVELLGIFHEGGYLAAAGGIGALFWVYRKLRDDIKTDITEAFNSLEKRLDKIERTLETMQQNHLDHLSQLHVNLGHGEPVNQGKES